MIVEIYADPMVNRKRLGPAVLLRKLVTYARTQTGWLVRFLAEPERTSEAWICS